MTIHAVVSIVALLWYMGLLALTLHRTAVKEPSRFAFGLYLAAMAATQVCYLLVSIAADARSAALAYYAMIPAVFLIFPTYWILVRAVARRPVRWLVFGIAGAAALGAAALAFTRRGEIFAAFRYDVGTGIFVPVFGALGGSMPSAIPIGAFLALSVFDLARGIRRAADAHDRRLLCYLAAGFAASTLCFSANSIPALRAYPVDVFGSVVSAGLIAIGMSQRQLLSVPRTARQGVVLTLPTLIAATAFFLVFSAVAWFMGGLEVREALVLSLLASLVSAFATGPFQKGLRRRLEASLFLREQILGEMVQRVSRRANTELELGALASLILEDVFATMQVARTGLFLVDEDSGRLVRVAEVHEGGPERSFGTAQPLVEELESCLEESEGRSSRISGLSFGDGAGTPEALVVRLVARGKAVGLLVVEPGRGARAFTALEAMTLETLANQTAAAVDNARLHRDLRRELEERVALQEQMVRMQKMEAIGSLAAGVAHDMNNVLAAVMGVASAALEERRSGTGASAADLEHIIVACHRGRELSDALLGFAKQRSVERAPLALHEVVEDVIVLLGRTIPKGIAIEKRFDDQCPSIEASRSQIHRVLMNICINAVAAMGAHGKLGFEIFAERLGAARTVGDVSLAPGAYALLAISDTGAGMEQETLRRAFDPFFTTRLNEGGTGLGLSLVYGIVSNHGGAVDIASALGAGTKVTIWLPANLDRHPEEKRDEPAPRERAMASVRVLVVDDEPMVLRATARVLEALGHECETALDGRQGIARFRASARRFDVVILDMVMPVMDGAEAFFGLREIDPLIPVILCSGYSDEEKGRALLSQENVAFLPKPFDAEALASRLSALVGRRAGPLT
jgi:signal transduction histidine kinase/CheY-like chemotaxis protein